MLRLSPMVSTAVAVSIMTATTSVLAESSPQKERHLTQQDVIPNNGEVAPVPPSNTEEPPIEEKEVLIGEIAVEGVEGDLKDRVFEAISVQPGQLATRSQLQQDVNAIFETGFFSNVRVAPKDTPLGVRLTFVVEANPTLEQVQVKTVPEDANKQVLPEKVVNNIFSQQYGDILNFQNLQDGVEQLNQWYQDNGYDLAQVINISEPAADGTVTLTVSEGVIADIQVRHLNEQGEEIDGKTRDFIVTREMQLSSGDVFNSDIARSDLQRVFGLGIFEDVNLSFEPGEDPRTAVVNVEVVEGNTGSIGAGAGVGSATGLFGTVSFQEQNLGGNNQNLSAQVQVGARDLLFNTSFRDPWIAGDPHRTSYSVDLFRRRSISVIFDEGQTEVELPDGTRPRVIRTGGGIQFSRPLAPDPYTNADWNLSAGFEYQRVQIQDSDGEIAPVDEFGNQLSFDDSGQDDLFLLEFDAINDNRNDPRQTSSGSILRLGLDQSIPVGSGNIFMTRGEVSYSQFIPVDFTNFTDKGAETIALNVQAGTILGDLPPYEAFSLGGTNSVRGYDQGALGTGQSFLQATAEYRFPIFEIISGALFVDFGTDLGTGSDVPGQPAVVRDKPGTGVGAGAGVRVNSPLGPIRVDYGVNDQGDTRFHFGVGERF